MEWKPSRSSRVSKDAVGRSAQRQALPTAENEQASPSHTVESHDERTATSPVQKSGWIVAICVAIVVALLLGWLLWSNNKNTATAIDQSKYQAVFLTNGQTYFGKLEPFTSKAMKLKDVYYLQVAAGQNSETENPQESTAQGEVELIKLGEELHAPEDEMIILLDRMLFYENLKGDSSLARSIEQHKKSKN